MRPVPLQRTIPWLFDVVLTLLLAACGQTSGGGSGSEASTLTSRTSRRATTFPAWPTRTALANTKQHLVKKKEAGVHKAFLIRSLLTGVITLLPAVIAQEQAITPQQAVQLEQAVGTFVQQGNSVAPSDFLQLIWQCTRAVGDVVEINGVPYFRVYEFDLINPTVYRLQGIQAVSNAIRRAEAKARGSAVKMMVGVATTFREIVADTNKQSTAGTATTTGKEEAIAASVSTETVNLLASITENSASGFLKGGRVSGTRLVSLGDAGMCVMVRFDVPLRKQGQGTSTPGTHGGAGSGSGNPGNAPAIPPGQKGDF